MAIIESFTPMIELLSVDEAFLDARGVMRQWKSSVKLAKALKNKIKNELNLTASVGIAANKFLAKLGSDLNKPDGLTVVPMDPERIIEFLAPMSVTRI